MQAVADLAARLSVSLDAIVVLSAAPVEWHDTGLGLPQPGYVYAHVLTPGYRIDLQAGATRYRYHSDMRRVVFAGTV